MVADATNSRAAIKDRMRIFYIEECDLCLGRPSLRTQQINANKR